MKINEVKKARDDQGTCGRCGTALPAGSAYRWIKGRYSARKVRCLESACRFRPSEMTESKLSAAYAAQETLEGFMAEWSNDDGIDNVKDACSEAAESIREVGQEYGDAAEAMGGAGEEMQEKADNLESWADEIESAGNDREDFEESYDDLIECPECHGGESHDDSAEHKGEGKYACKACKHEFELAADEVRNGDGQTREEWADEVRSAVEDAIGNCPV